MSKHTTVGKFAFPEKSMVTVPNKRSKGGGCTDHAALVCILKSGEANMGGLK